MNLRELESCDIVTGGIKYCNNQGTQKRQVSNHDNQTYLLINLIKYC